MPQLDGGTLPLQVTEVAAAKALEAAGGSTGGGEAKSPGENSAGSPDGPVAMSADAAYDNFDLSWDHFSRFRP